jgi:hypothetical protein
VASCSGPHDTTQLSVSISDKAGHEAFVLFNARLGQSVHVEFFGVY